MALSAGCDEEWRVKPASRAGSHGAGPGSPQPGDLELGGPHSF